MADQESTVRPGATAAVSQQVPPGHQLLYTRTGTPLIVAEENVAATMHELGLITEQYNLEDATAELLAKGAMLGDTISRTAAEVTASGYIDETLEGVVNAAVGEFRLAFDHWSRCIGALLPTEALVRDVAVHKARAGDLSAVPGHARREAVADAYAESHDLAEHAEREGQREQLENAVRVRASAILAEHPTFATAPSAEQDDIKRAAHQQAAQELGAP